MLALIRFYLSLQGRAQISLAIAGPSALLPATPIPTFDPSVHPGSDPSALPTRITRNYPIRHADKGPPWGWPPARPEDPRPRLRDPRPIDQLLSSLHVQRDTSPDLKRCDAEAGAKTSLFRTFTSVIASPAERGVAIQAHRTMLGALPGIRDPAR
jgi:hypothetical protein